MPVYRLGPGLVFPDPEDADEQGIIAVGGDLSPERLLLAYTMGIFPWYHDGLPILWHSPDPRMVLFTSELHVPASLRKTIRRGAFELRYDTRFAEVIDACAQAPREGQDGTWITREMRDAYVRLHELGFAHSVEAFRDDELVGGLYGVSLGAMFFGESMFARVSDASKVAFVHLAERLGDWGVRVIDCQQHTEHLARFGAREISRREFLDHLEAALAAPTRRGAWTER